MVKGHRPWAPGAECDSKSILRLQSNEWFDDELINAVSGLVEAPADCRTFLLPSHIYNHLKVGKFSKVDKWVKGLPKDQARWAFGICQRKHWVVILIVFDIEGISILYYDPWADENPDHARRIDTLEVSSVSL